MASVKRYRRSKGPEPVIFLLVICACIASILCHARPMQSSPAMNLWEIYIPSGFEQLLGPAIRLEISSKRQDTLKFHQ
ncbi:hypothetical protein BO78DRAFT_392319 [Aspergillus sclerotiicarbonarius CBS 121057]|uniref:Uncharacterized protein n=1 Tax=Aspergillus sclerotiicarbonarius (strain CBS 121057 / IBT 28362) TaxID=1448318 RepID=A0A319ESS1_ASPSB|nr:hypothetical protein BO78DRAFT_392319 [Aspergillus sclerotiicarbonarius CBS 121057]